MTANTIPVEAQWALHGKKADNEGYRVLACSNGHLSMDNFTEALNRFRIGAVDTLPQVSVSYARQGTQPGVNYLALAIHWFAEDGQRLADGVRQFDVHGRATAFTSYFCAPYRPLAKGAITYQHMYEAFSGLMLPVEKPFRSRVCACARGGRRAQARAQTENHYKGLRVGGRGQGGHGLVRSR